MTFPTYTNFVPPAIDASNLNEINQVIYNMLGSAGNAPLSTLEIRNNLGLGSLATQSNVNLATQVTGTLAVANGGTGATTAQAAKTNLAIAPEGQCQLTLSGANLLLSRLDGSYITINGVQEIIPSGGVTLAPAGAAASTRYYIYVFMNAGTMTMEFSTTVPVVDSTTGVKVKTGDASRTLVGQAQSTAGSAWVDQANNRGVISWFNKRPIQVIQTLNGNISTASASFTEMDPSYRISFLSWSGDVVDMYHTGIMANSAVGTCNVALTGISGVVGTGQQDGATSFTAAGAGYASSANVRKTTTASADGYSTIGILGATAAGTFTLSGGATAALRCTLCAVIQG